MGNVLTYAIIMLIAGIGIPVMAALNGGLGIKLGSSSLAAVILFIVGLCCTFTYALLSGGLVSETKFSSIPWYFYLGGVFVTFYIVSVSTIAPRFGVSNAIAFVLLGQLLAMSIIDHFGLFGVTQYTLNIPRIIGLMMIATGVFLVMGRSSG